MLGVSGWRSLAAALVLGSAAAHAESDSVLMRFTLDAQGSQPETGVIAGPDGSLYGTTYGGGSTFGNPLGTVFRLTPPGGGKSGWTEQVLHVFQGKSDGGIPKGGLVMDAKGALYGTTYQGGDLNCDFGLGCGTVFRLAPPPAGKSAWTLTTLHTFTGTFQGVAPDGIHPWAGLVFDKKGALYGTTDLGGTTGCLAQGCGTVFKLAPPAGGAGAWTETVLHKFTDSEGGMPKSGVIFDSSGALYGSAPGELLVGGVCCGIVYKLSPPAKAGGGWTEETLHAFVGTDGAYPEGGLLLGPGGILYGTTAGDGQNNYGTVFELTPPPKGKTKWGGNVLVTILGQQYSGPNGTLVRDSTGALYFATGFNYGQPQVGAVVKVTPPGGSQTKWVPTVLHGFGANGDGYGPSGPLILLKGALYGTTASGWSPSGDAMINGTVFRLAP